MTMANTDVDDELSSSGALQRVVDDVSGTDSEDHSAAVSEVEDSQEELSQAFADLAGVVERSVDPVRWITERPHLCLLGGFALGFWFGGRR